MQMPPLGRGIGIQHLIGECVNQGIRRVKHIWLDEEDDQDFWVCAEREWWECRGPGEEVDRL